MTAIESAIKEAVEKNCEICGNVYSRNLRYSEKQWARSRYCSFQCGGRALRRRMPEPWNKGLKCPQLGGENHHLWRGGVTPEHEKIRHSLKYYQWRDAVYKRDDYTCQDCGERGGRLQADHIKPFAYFPKLRFDMKKRILKALPKEREVRLSRDCADCSTIPMTFCRHDMGMNDRLEEIRTLIQSQEPLRDIIQGV